VGEETKLTFLGQLQLYRHFFIAVFFTMQNPIQGGERWGIQSSLAVHKFCAAGKERCEQGLWCLMSWHPKCNRSYVSSADLPSNSLRKNLAWWAVTRRTSKNHKTVKIGGWALPWDITVMPSCQGSSRSSYQASMFRWGGCGKVRSTGL